MTEMTVEDQERKARKIDNFFQSHHKYAYQDK